jgi:O-acetyl-ADP-ribose deacetylase (regulator of RNase III)
MLTYKQGDLYKDPLVKHSIIVHCCNNRNAFGSGFARATLLNYPHAKRSYHAWFNQDQLSTSYSDELLHLYRDNLTLRSLIKLPYWATSDKPDLGEVQFASCNEYDHSDGDHVTILPSPIICNLIGQEDYGGFQQYNNEPYVSYEAIRSGLEKVAIFAGQVKKKIYMPMIGAGLARGDWSIIEPIIEDTLQGHDVTIFRI